MIWIKVCLTTFTVLLVTAALRATEPTKKDVDITSLNEHMKKTDALLQEVQSHSQAQEQKYSAVLSSVLSQLTQTTEELEELKASVNTTEDLQQEVLNLKEELKNLTDINNNAQLELAQLNQSHNRTLYELEQLNQSHNETLYELEQLNQSHNETLLGLDKVKREVLFLQKNCSDSYHKSDSNLHGSIASYPSKPCQPNRYAGTENSLIKNLEERLALLNSTQIKFQVSLSQIMGRVNVTGSKMACFYKDIGFEASLVNSTVFRRLSTIVFDNLNQNEGSGYNKTTGYFTVPVSGTYLFWTNMVYKSNGTATIFYIKTSNKVLGIAFGEADELFGTASATILSYLSKEEPVWISPNKDVELVATFPSAGAVLIKQY